MTGDTARVRLISEAALARNSGLPQLPPSGFKKDMGKDAL
jgi:hypothetical protein